MPKYQVRLKAEGADPRAGAVVDVPVTEGEHLSDAEIERRAGALADEMADIGQTGWTLKKATRK